MPPTGADRPLNTTAITCMAAGSADGTDNTPFRGSACTTAGETCVASNTTTSGGARGCVCWNVAGAGLMWHCGSTNNWFRLAADAGGQ
jgi:hypothetical protein